MKALVTWTEYAAYAAIVEVPSVAALRRQIEHAGVDVLFVKGGCGVHPTPQLANNGIPEL